MTGNGHLPCSDPYPELCRALGRHIVGPLLDAWRTRPEIRALWLEEAGLKVVPPQLKHTLGNDVHAAEPPAAPAKAACVPCAQKGCVHLGARTGERADGVRGRPMPLFACAVHGRCTLHAPAEGIACCKGCPDRQERQPPVNLPPFVDRVYLINLKSRKDRLDRFRQLQRERGWRLPEPIVMPAIRGDTVGVPSFFTQGGGAWGCKLSHCRILEDCLMDGVESVLVLEDDVEWFDDAWGKLDAFLRAVPADWDQLMLGGQHQRRPDAVSPGVVRCKQTERTHAYAVRGKALKSLLHLWYNCTVHIDWDMGRRWQKDWKVYAPEPFAFGQGGGKSDISGRHNPPQYWVEPRDYSVVVLDAPPDVVRELRENHNWHFGYTRDRDGRDAGLNEIARIEGDGQRRKLRRWIDTLAWECASLRDAVLTVWHPGVSAALVRNVHARTIEIRAATVAEALLSWERYAKSP